MDVEARIQEQRLLRTYEEALIFLDGYALATHPRLKDKPKLGQMEMYMAYLGNPQRALRVLHVAGTSGKGSTSTILARLLQTTGRRVGLIVSPHLMDIRERIQVNGQMISCKRFVDILNRQIPSLHQMQTSGLGLLSYFGLLLAMAICFFEEEGVEYAVLETGIGGRFDFTNAIHGQDKIAVLTKIGFDHMGFLGDTLAKIAWEKAGIIPDRGDVFTIEQDPEVMRVFEEEVRLQRAFFNCIRPKQDLKIRSVQETGTLFDVQTSSHYWKDLRLGLIGEHQAENTSLALAVFERVRDRDHLPFDEQLIRTALQQLVFEGRGEMVSHNGKTIFFDVAHNPQKMEALCKTIHSLWPEMKPYVVMAFGHDAQSESMLRILNSVTDELLLADFIVGEGAYRYKFKDLELLEDMAQKQGFISLQRATTATEAWQKAFTAPQSILVVTGSVHFVSCMRTALLADKKKTM